LLIFIHIVERPKMDIFSTFVFNNIVEHTLFFTPPVLPPRLAQQRIRISISMTSKFLNFSRKSDK